MRDKDQDIPDDEPLYRKLKAEWVLDGMVLPEAADLAGTSCDRSKYRPSPSTLIEGHWVAVASVKGEDLPKNFRPAATAPAETSSGPGVQPTWEFFAEDVPLAKTDKYPENDAHCEIRVRRTGQTSRENDKAVKKRPHELREELKAELAAAFCLVPP